MQELENLSKGLSKTVKSEIPEVDQHHFHVVLLKDNGTKDMKADIGVSMAAYHQEGYEKMKKNFKYQGYSRMILLHEGQEAKAAQKRAAIETAQKRAQAVLDGAAKTTAAITAASQTLGGKAEVSAEVMAELKAAAKIEAKAELEAEAKAEAEALKAEQEAAALAQRNRFGDTIAKMVEYAKENNIDLGDAKKSDEIFAVLDGADMK